MPFARLAELIYSIRALNWTTFGVCFPIRTATRNYRHGAGPARRRMCSACSRPYRNNMNDGNHSGIVSVQSTVATLTAEYMLHVFPRYAENTKKQIRIELQRFALFVGQ